MEKEAICLSVPELAKRLGISRVGAYQLANSAGFPTVRIGRRLVVPVAALEKWLEEQSRVERAV